MSEKIITINNIPVKVEIADTEDSRQLGLMNRSYLEDGCGMIFVFEDSQPRGFWMKNTSIPLSIAFISDTGEILNIENMYPHDMSIVRSKGSAMSALEVNQGWFRKNGILPGDKIIEMLNESFFITREQIGDIVKKIILD